MKIVANTDTTSSTPSSSDAIALNDRALNYGDGVFTTMCVSHGKAELLSFHLARLNHDAKALAISLDMTALKQAIDEYINTLTASLEHPSIKKVMKIHVSSGEGGRGYARDAQAPAIVRFSSHTYPTHYAELQTTGLSVICAKTPLAIQPLLGGIKHMNRLEQVLVKREVIAANADDALVFDTQGHLIEASAGNVFFQTDSGWHTPKVNNCGVNGVVRQCLLSVLKPSSSKDSDISSNALVVNEGEYTLADVANAKALVITNALMGVMPVNNVVLNEGKTGDELVFNASHEGAKILARLVLDKIQEDHANSY
ncbi:aminodeoxychorismate lyase [Alteromonas sp. CI.11.F.A3]|uniref:aminodeoxychorismate lyase n=1 Tax=Alteromonas sp. CI.11.F.A3 TaxID=3079555 RepID=UPI002943DBE6|nr:aminodeoxychorismate lyase [Alteromonas sp. CI.11.F.A3]WOI36021.1 aminodeoxychorismate lyase [Alteromonas sp. CI.11.F.A3]